MKILYNPDTFKKQLKSSLLNHQCLGIFPTFDWPFYKIFSMCIFFFFVINWACIFKKLIYTNIPILTNICYFLIVIWCLNNTLQFLESSVKCEWKFCMKWTENMYNVLILKVNFISNEYKAISFRAPCIVIL